MEWRIHDRTHLEFAIDYPIGEQPGTHTWEAYFFVPESFRLHQDSYDKKEIYDDLWSYVRYAVPPLPFFDLSARAPGSSLSELIEALTACEGQTDESPLASAAMRQLRLHACRVRVAGLSAVREVEKQLARVSEPDGEAQIRALVAGFLTACPTVTTAMRAVLTEFQGRSLPDSVNIAARWVDEDVSLVIETFCATLGISLARQSTSVPALEELGEQLATLAVSEAQHRTRAGYSSVGSAQSSQRSVEHLEFRRHVLKRFTASALWLSLEVRTGAQWLIHALYAVAAALAMSVALFASFHTTTPTGENLFRYALLVVLAYAVKDRLKAFLQSVFAGIIAKRLPDRKWSIRDRERGHNVGKVLERAAFLPFRSLPAAVLERRRVTREHALEEFARPERVLWHQKTITVAGHAEGASAGFPMLTEIFRLNLRRWLVHTDDPNRKIVFADPSDANVYSATARRVYNINVVYRLNPAGGDAPWQRLRVVVSRKGLERIESIG